MSGYYSKEPNDSMCPKCRGAIPAAAKICPYCGHDRYHDPYEGFIMKLAFIVVGIYLFLSWISS